MSPKVAFFCFAQALLFQIISSSYIGYPYNSANDVCSWGAPGSNLASASSWNAAWATSPMPGVPIATAEWAPGYSPANLVASNGGGLAITSASPIAPTGVAMTSENSYGGALGVSGALPYLGAVALEGAVPTGGAGGVTYTCGNGNVAMLTEDLAAVNYNGAYGYGPGTIAEVSYGPATLAEVSYTAPVGYEAAAPGYGYSRYGSGAILL